MEINKIIKMKNNKYKIYIDGETIITYDNVILENNLLYKKKVDKDLYNKILSDTSYFDIYNKIVKYILKRRRSEKEINLYLTKLEVNNSNKNNIINKLKEINLINDIEYCKAYINDKLYLSKDGINKIKQDLINQNISIDVIEKEFRNIDINIFNDRLEKLIIKKIKNNKKYSSSFLKQKILTEMINLGYNKDKILDILNNNIEFDNNILEKEFNKIYNKLNKRYSGIELENKIKQKLIQKGFKVEGINKLLQEKTED